MATDQYSPRLSACFRGWAGLGLLGWALASLAAGISPTDRYAWSENTGWFNFNSANNSASVQVYADHLEGYVWAENIGWIRLGTHTGGGAHTYANNFSTNYGVNHNGAGALSGYAWSENAGWINFQGVTLNSINSTTSQFDGYAWGENIGYIHFRNASPAYQVVVLGTFGGPGGPGGVPALGPWGLSLLIGLLVGLGGFHMGRRRRVYQKLCGGGQWKILRAISPE